jgi:hypothetical protein
MTGYELKSILDKYDRPPTHSNKSEVFSLYYRITGKRNDRNCLNCAIECFLELKHIAKHYAENEIILSLYKKKDIMESVNPSLTKYRVKRPFRVFGSAKIYSNLNTTDQEVEFLINFNKSLINHFEFLEEEFNDEVFEMKTLAEEVMPEVVAIEDITPIYSSNVTKEKKKRKPRKKRI